MTKRLEWMAITAAMLLCACGDDDAASDAATDSTSDTGGDDDDDADDDDDSGDDDDDADDDDDDGPTGKTSGDPIPLDEAGDTFSGTLADSDDFFFFSVPYTPNYYGFILRTPESNTNTVTAGFHDTPEGGATSPGTNGCFVYREAVPDDGSCGIQIDYTNFGSDPEVATIIVFGEGAFELELVRLAGPIAAPDPLPTARVRIMTTREATSLDPVTYDAPRRFMIADRGPDETAVFFPLPSDPSATCWVRPTNFSNPENTFEGVDTLTFTSDVATITANPAAAFGGTLSAFAEGEAFGSNDDVTLAIDRSASGTDEDIARTTPTFSSQPTLEAIDSVLTHDFSSVTGLDRWYMRFEGNNKVVECEAPITASTDSVAAISSAVGRDIEARGITTNRIVMGACASESEATFTAGDASYAIFLCLAVGVDPADLIGLGI